MKRFVLIISLVAASWSVALAQQDMSNMQGMQHTQTIHDTSSHKTSKDNSMPGMNMHETSGSVMKGMSSGLSRSLSMSRDGSGTAWLPDASPMYAIMVHRQKWMFMFHGDVFIRYDRQDIGNAGSRGGDKWDAPDMLMAMAQRKVGKKGLLHFNLMMSADALIAGGSGYPLLFQTGESWHGQPLVDRQHPHDLFSELSASYAYELSAKSDLYLYAGYPGEPALGPVTFMHRPSGEFMPDAPIGHHWADATHITFGVATVGYRYGKFKLEGSSFTGREPDENRYNFDKPLFDSWSGRLSYNPSENWALQISRGYIKSPEALRPEEDIDRSTASATYLYPITSAKYFTATALWGQNITAGQQASNAALLEAIFKLQKLALYMRYEWVQKSGEELNLDPAAYNAASIFPLNTITAGAGYDLFKISSIIVAGGAQISVSHSSNSLQNLYGQNPVSGEVYLHIYPSML
jgi:hypothetical protein